jgi:hypothetical protein
VALTDEQARVKAAYEAVKDVFPIAGYAYVLACRRQLPAIDSPQARAGVVKRDRKAIGAGLLRYAATGCHDDARAVRPSVVPGRELSPPLWNRSFSRSAGVCVGAGDELMTAIRILQLDGELSDALRQPRGLVQGDERVAVGDLDEVPPG